MTDDINLTGETLNWADVPGTDEHELAQLDRACAKELAKLDPREPFVPQDAEERWLAATSYALDALYGALAHREGKTAMEEVYEACDKAGRKDGGSYDE